MKRLLSVLMLALVLVLVLAPVAGAQGPTPPALPSLEQLLTMSLRALGGLIFIALFAWAWGYFVSAIAARVPVEWNIPSRAYDLLILIPIAAVAAGWNAFASYLDVAFPGALDKTVGAVLLWIANSVFALLFARRGGIAQVLDLNKLGIQSTKAIKDGATTVVNARSGVLFVR